MDPDLETFVSLFQANDDPWGFRTRWYETRKRELTLACLPKARYSNAYEPGCANGELLAALATRCERLQGSDGVSAAVELARQRVAKLRHVEVVEALLPREWPQDRFDLIVISELGFYFSREQLSDLVVCIGQSLLGAGTVLACHWRHPVEGFAFNGDDVHQTLHAGLMLPRVVHHEERDLVIDVWCADARSVAEREGFV
ncbi:MAG: SAM-dependent methyltransferase [Burkholderiaceae bacterium]